MAKILFVDDKEDSRIIHKRILESDGHTVQTAANGAEALQMAAAALPAMIISDILMPVMDGFQLCLKVRADDRLKHIFFVFYTATYTDAGDEALALKSGADKFIRKPAEPSEFSKLIQDMFKDLGDGKAHPRKPAFAGNKEIYQLYSERLVSKLEKKILALENEISAHRRSAVALKRSLHANQALLKELHHRVKNNLQIISSLLDMIVMRTQDKKMAGMLADARSKIHSMALIHTQLLKDKRLDQINIDRHVAELTEHLATIYAKENITTITHIDPPDMYFTLARAVPVALVLNELVANAFKHAFACGRKGTIKISLSQTADGMIRLHVKDDGRGFPTGYNLADTNDLGLKLVRNTVLGQLAGKIDIEHGKGTAVVVEFKITAQKETDYAENYDRG